MSTSYALAVPQPRTHRALLYGTRARLAGSSGDVEGYLTLATFDKRAGTASYALRIVNQSQHPLRARMSCAKLRRESVLAYPLDVHIAPFAISETLLPVRLADVGPYDRAVVQVSGGDIAFSLEAPSPPAMKRRSRWMVYAAGALAFCFAAAIGAGTATPSIATISAPARVFPGSSVDVPYAFGGWASMQYALKTRDGRQLTAGVVRSHEGTLHFNVPSAAGRDVILAVQVSGPFGTKSISHRIRIAGRAPFSANAAPAAPGAPRVSEFAVVTPVVHANGYLRLRYVTDARDGEIWLLDEAGRLWARAPIDRTGSTTISLPQGTAGRQLRAVLHARSGQADTIASVGVTVLPGVLASSNDDAPDVVKPSQATLTLSKQSAAPGETITIAIEGDHGDAQVSLNDGAGNTVEQGELLAGQSALVLTAPKTSTQKTYYVMANVIQGRGEQTMVKTLTVTPR